MIADPLAYSKPLRARVDRFWARPNMRRALNPTPPCLRPGPKILGPLEALGLRKGRLGEADDGSHPLNLSGFRFTGGGGAGLDKPGRSLLVLSPERGEGCRLEQIHIPLSTAHQQKVTGNQRLLSLMLGLEELVSPGLDQGLEDVRQGDLTDGVHLVVNDVHAAIQVHGHVFEDRGEALILRAVQRHGQGDLVGRVVLWVVDLRLGKAHHEPQVVEVVEALEVTDADAADELALPIDHRHSPGRGMVHDLECLHH
mmetsp:Transcript_28089/g.47708  ORF Transcript_28089/g.47708 Transcript_28089/m.47708 type:complete len:255 (+) Transcript_28089:1088-1852(+)